MLQLVQPCATPIKWGSYRHNLQLIGNTERRHNFFGNSETEAPFLLAFIGYLKEEAPFYWVNLGGGWWTCFDDVQLNMLEVGWSFILWSMLSLEGWSSSYFIGVTYVVHET